MRLKTYILQTSCINFFIRAELIRYMSSKETLVYGAMLSRRFMPIYRKYMCIKRIGKELR